MSGSLCTRIIAVVGSLAARRHLYSALELTGTLVNRRLSCRIRGSVSSGQGWAVAAEGQHGEGDQGVGVLEAEGGAGDEPDLGVDRSISPLDRPCSRAAWIAGRWR